MTLSTYKKRRGQLETYFDRTALDAWRKLTSDEAVSGIRATVRAGRDEMRNTLLSWLPDDMHGYQLLDAGCGTGALSMEVAQRGCKVIAVDISPSLINLAIERLPNLPHRGLIEFRAGDMLNATNGPVHFTCAMDSLIHYDAADIVSALEIFASRTSNSVIFTFAPSNLALKTMHLSGKLFPSGDRSPAIVPISEMKLRRLIGESITLRDWQIAATKRISRGFYISQAMQLKKKRMDA